MSENSRDDKHPMFLNGWMTDQYENGAKPPVGRMTPDTSTEAVRAKVAILRKVGLPRVTNLLEAIVAERDAKGADAAHYKIAYEAAAKVADQRSDDIAALRAENERLKAEVAGLPSVRVRNDGVWLTFNTKKGLHASLGMSALIDRQRGGLITAALNQWFNEQLETHSATLSTKEPNL